MTRRKKKRILVGAFGGVCALLLVDRLFFGTTSAVEEAKASETPVVAAQAVGDRAAGEVGNAEQVHPAMIAARFDAFREGSAFETAVLLDVFAPADWAQAGSAEPIIAEQVRDQTVSANEFRTRHRLHAVISGGSTAGVILDGAFVKVGEEVDGYTLRETTPRSAAFVNGETEIRLELTRPEF